MAVEVQRVVGSLGTAQKVVDGVNVNLHSRVYTTHTSALSLDGAGSFAAGKTARQQNRREETSIGPLTSREFLRPKTSELIGTFCRDKLPQSNFQPCHKIARESMRRSKDNGEEVAL